MPRALRWAYGGGAVFYERDTPLCCRHSASAFRVLRAGIRFKGLEVKGFAFRVLGAGIRVEGVEIMG